MIMPLNLFRALGDWIRTTSGRQHSIPHAAEAAALREQRVREEEFLDFYGEKLKTIKEAAKERKRRC